MGKGVLVKYHSFDENGLETVQEKTVLKVYVLTIPGFNGGPDSDYLVLSNQNTVMIPSDNLNFIEFNDKTYHLRNISDLNICCNDIQTELDLTDID
jgi:hypothetical protein